MTFLTATIPVEAGEGIYRLEVVAEDGDVSASLELTVTAWPAAAGADPSGATPDMDHMAGMPSIPTARADDVTIERSGSGAGWALIGGLIGMAAGLGIGLLSRRPPEVLGP